MAYTGFDPVKIKSSINSVMDAYSDLQDALITVTQNQFVTPMTTLWCCKESVDFFKNKFQPAIEALNDGAFKTFKSVVETMDSSATTWAKRTGNTSDWSKMTFTPVMKKIDISGIKDKNDAGEIGIDEVQAVLKAGLLLTKTFVKASAALVKASAAVQFCGFIGGDQAANLQSSLKTIKTNLENTTKEMASAAKESIESSANAYGSVRTNISSAFTISSK